MSNIESKTLKLSKLRFPNPDGEDEDDDDLLCPETAQLLPQDSSSSNENINNDDVDDEQPSLTASGQLRRHCHAPIPHTKEKTKAKIQLLITSVLCFLFMMGEIAGKRVFTDTPAPKKKTKKQTITNNKTPIE